MRTLTRRILAAGAVAGLLAIPAANAGAETQEVTGTVDQSVTIDSAPAAAALGTLPVTGFDAGSITVSANESYILQVASDKATMTSWDGTNYGTNALSSAMTMTSTATSTNGSGLGAAAAISTTPMTIGSNALGTLLSTTDTYDLAVNQDATALDPAGNYRFVLTYTASLNV